ncbi:DUF1028 domain-containing protein [Reyranella sp. CPCC 100927]|uniref:DUF1028 domain-containing protein n=1 Tax=Reyranella sp. CPCC 100927 TaxID=2599616 RepID=UPI0011B3D01D|nr:DUF1028 domain-containing protein [Reyranella sp. CPCC 100927]TWT04054.1 DUF1028 domain-containing protein [Reyranella sp. CPCC 100927]
MTWSIVAHDPASGAFGICVATRAFAVGARVPHIASGVGAIATQANTNALYGTRGLRLLTAGVPAADVVRLLTEADAGHDHRQLHVRDAQGRSAAHTGAQCVPWCGHRIGDGFSVAGNMLAGPQVIEETAKAFAANAALPFPRRLIAALRAGEAVGGDKRGKQSAALKIYSTEEYPDFDFRVDDHVEPLAELARLEQVSRERFAYARLFSPRHDDPVGLTDFAEITRRVDALKATDTMS